MADARRLSSLPAITPAAEDVIYLERGGVSSRTTLGQLAALILSGGSPSPGVVPARLLIATGVL